MVIETSPNVENIYLKNKHVLIARFDNLNGGGAVMGNEKANMALFKKIKIKREISWYLIRILYKLLIFTVNFIPIKNMRKNMRKSINYLFYKSKL